MNGETIAIPEKELKHIAFWLDKYTLMHGRADTFYDKTNIGNEFFAEVSPGLLKVLMGVLENGNNRTGSAGTPSLRAVGD